MTETDAPDARITPGWITHVETRWDGPRKRQFVTAAFDAHGVRVEARWEWNRADIEPHEGLRLVMTVNSDGRWVPPWIRLLAGEQPRLYP